MNFAVSVRLLAIVICFCGLLAAQVPPIALEGETMPAQIDAGVEFHVLLHARGGVPPYTWSVVEGDLPDGLTLTPDGFLSGRPTRPGTFEFTLKVEDSAQPAHSITKQFQVTVAAPLLLEWLRFPKVHDNRIDGSVQVSNGTKDAFDLTVIIVAVAENGRATAIGYQHFELKPGATNVEIPFGSTMPYGSYVVHADAIAENPRRNSILRQRLQTPQSLQIVQTP
jgi:Putative Ig domain